MVATDFDAYTAAQRDVDALWCEPSLWWEKAILNTARMGWFSSDRTIRAVCGGHLEGEHLACRLPHDEGGAVAKEPTKRRAGGRGAAAGSTTQPSRRWCGASTATRSPCSGCTSRAAGSSPAPSSTAPTRLEAFTLGDKPAGTLERRHDAGFFEGRLSVRERQPLKYRARNAGASGRSATRTRSARCSGRWTTITSARAATFGSSTGWARTRSGTRARTACTSRSGRRTRAGSASSATSTPGTDAGT